MVQPVSVVHMDRKQMRDYTADEIADALRVQRIGFLRDGPPTAAVRQNRIDRLAALTLENGATTSDAMRRDFATRPVQAAIISDLLGSLSDVAFIRRNLVKWMKAR